MLRTVSGEQIAAQEGAAAQLQGAFEVNPLAELVADVIEATGILAPDKIAFVRDRARTGSFAQALVEEGLAEGESIARSFALRHNLTVVDIVSTGVSPEAAELIPLHVLERVCAIPYAIEGDKLADRDRGSAERARDRRASARHQVTSSRSQSRPERTSKSRSGGSREPRRRSAPVRCSRKRRSSRRSPRKRTISRPTTASRTRRSSGSSTPSIFQAAEDGASDMHFEPQKDGIVVRFRIDGVLHEVQRIPKRMTAGVTTRLKVLAKLDIAERRKPQDGRISLNARTAGRMLDIRVATLPTVDGEKLSMRLLDKSKKAPTLEELGLPDDMQKSLSEIIRPPDRRSARDRPDRLRQVDVALRRPGRDQPAGDQHRDDRGSGRVPA